MRSLPWISAYSVLVDLWALRVKRGCEGNAAVLRGVQEALAPPGHSASPGGRISDRKARCRADRAKLFRAGFCRREKVGLRS